MPVTDGLKCNLDISYEKKFFLLHH